MYPEQLALMLFCPCRGLLHLSELARASKAVSQGAGWVKNYFDLINFMNGILWDELYDVKKHTVYLIKYIYFLKSVKKFFELTTIALTSSGFIVWLSDKGSVWTGVSAGLATGVKLLELIQDKLIANDEYMEDVAELRDKWCDYFNELESLWIGYRVGTFNEKQASDQFGSFKKVKADIDKSDARIKIWIIWTVNRKSNTETTNYMKRYLTN